jgi:hypothetical protein
LPVDWELCGLATGPLDFAALTTGLPEAEANLLVEAYVQKLPETPRDLGQLLERCRLHLAIEWAGRHRSSMLEIGPPRLSPLPRS